MNRKTEARYVACVALVTAQTHDAGWHCRDRGCHDRARAAVVTATPASINGIILLVGADESQRVVNWYASANTSQVVQVAPTSELQNGEFPNDATTYPAVVAANTVNGGFNGHAILDDLKENTVYSYRVGGDGAWSATYQFKTRKFDGNFDFLFFGDPQIGSSGNVPKDQAGWEDTLKVALAANPDAELLVSGGDQVETAGIETQWTAFLAPNGLRSYPWVATIGNHDVGSRAYEQHLWTPNTDRSPSLYRSGSPTNQSGGDYWFIYKGVLFIDLNSNAFYTSGQAGVDADAAHIDFITNVVAQHGAEANYTVLVYHHSIYSPADHANDTDNKKRRLDFPAAFSQLGVDLVLQGHDHSYSRSYLIESGVKQNPGEQPGATSVFQGPGGVIYVTGNSASGSKYYALTVRRVQRSPRVRSRQRPALRPGSAQPREPLAQLGGEPGARAQLRQGLGAQQPPLRREHPQRHVRGSERGV